MNTEYSSDAFVLVGDEPVSSQKLKRLLLTHKRVYFSDISDEAIVNEKEVIERFPGLNGGVQVVWSARGHYPRVGSYREMYFDSLNGADMFMSRSLLTPIASRNVRTIDPGIYWMSHSSALSNEELLTAASVDATSQDPSLLLKDTVICGLEVSISGFKSKYAVGYKPPKDLDNVSRGWNSIARLRVGRALKSVRIAQALGASPVAIDRINSEILYAMMKQTFPFPFNKEILMDFAIETTIIDNDMLESALSCLSWKEIAKIRREILPATSKTREYLFKETNKFAESECPTTEDYIKSLERFKGEFAALRDKELEAWEALRIGSVFKSAGFVGALSLGTVAIPSLTSFPTLLTTLISAGLVSSSALTPELKQLIPARSRVRKHPLYLIEKLTR